MAPKAGTGTTCRSVIDLTDIDILIHIFKYRHINTNFKISIYRPEDFFKNGCCFFVNRMSQVEVLSLDCFESIHLTEMLLKYYFTVIYYTAQTHGLMCIPLHCNTITPEQYHVGYSMYLCNMP